MNIMDIRQKSPVSKWEPSAITIPMSMWNRIKATSWIFAGLIRDLEAHEVETTDTTTPIRKRLAVDLAAADGVVLEQDEHPFIDPYLATADHLLKRYQITQRKTRKTPPATPVEVSNEVA